MIGAIGSEFGEVQQQRQRREGGVMATMMDELFDANDDARKHAEDADLLRAVNAELLAALRDITEAAEESWPERACVRVARAAIARAEGETKNRAG